MNIYYIRYFSSAIVLMFMLTFIMFNRCYSQDQTPQVNNRIFKLFYPLNIDFEQELDSLFLTIEECSYYKNTEDLFWKISFYKNKEGQSIFEITLATSPSLTYEYIGLYYKNDLSVIISGDKELADSFFKGTSKNKRVQWKKKSPTPEDFSLWIYEIDNNGFSFKKEYLLHCD